MRDFWRSHAGLPRRVRVPVHRAPRTSSPRAGRRPTASVNLITVHDGFTLADLVSYDVKHNEANGEDNRDGTDDNRSWNCGAEGPTTDPGILALARPPAARLARPPCSCRSGCPLLLGGDELGRTQQGNNNAYCQDNAITWFDWSGVDADLLGLHPAGWWRCAWPTPCFRRRRFLAGAEASELRLVHAVGRGHDRGRLGGPERPGLGLYLDGSDDPDRAADGSALVDDDFLMLVNAWWEPLDFIIPPARPDQTWYGEIDTFDPSGHRGRPRCPQGAQCQVGPRSVVVLRGPLGATKE